MLSGNVRGRATSLTRHLDWAIEQFAAEGAAAHSRSCHAGAELLQGIKRQTGTNDVGNRCIASILAIQAQLRFDDEVLRPERPLTDGEILLERHFYRRVLHVLKFPAKPASNFIFGVLQLEAKFLRETRRRRRNVEGNREGGNRVGGDGQHSDVELRAQVAEGVRPVEETRR